MTWLAWIGGGTILSIIGSVIAIIKSGIMLPKEVEGADLNNRKTETEILQKMQEMLKNAINDTAEWQNKFDKLDCEARNNKDELEKLQNKTSQQDERILELETIYKDQKQEIIELTAEVNNYYLWTNALVKQLEKADLKPVRMEDVEGIDLSVIKKSKMKK